MIALVVACLFWGTTGTAASFLPPEVSRVSVGAATMGIGGIILFLVTARRAIVVIRDRATWPWLGLGLLSVIAYPLTFYPAMELAGVAIGNVLALGTGPVFAALLEWVVERHRPGAVWLCSALVAVAGIALLGFGGHGSVSGTGDLLPGVGLGLVAGLAYACYTYSAGRVMRLGHPSTPVMGAMFGLGAIALIPILLMTGGGILGSSLSVGIIAYLVAGPAVIAYVLFGIGIGALRSSTVLVITLLEPVFTTVLAVVVVGERPTVLAWLGIGSIIAAIVLVSLGALRRPRGGPGEPSARAEPVPSPGVTGGE